MPLKKDYLNPKWQKKRLEILERDNFTCTECGTTEETLHVHHSHYVKSKKYWDYPNSSFRVLCDECHKIEHESIKQIDPYKIRRLSILLHKIYDRTCTAKYGRWVIKAYEYYSRLVIEYFLYGDSEEIFEEFGGDNIEDNDDINNFKILENLMYYMVNPRNVKDYVSWCYCINGIMESPSFIGKHKLEIHRFRG